MIFIKLRNKIALRKIKLTIYEFSYQKKIKTDMLKTIILYKLKQKKDFLSNFRFEIFLNKLIKNMS